MANKKIKVAVCFYGQVRLLETFKLFYSKWKHPSIELDFFIATWNDYAHGDSSVHFTDGVWLPYKSTVKNWEEGNTQKMSYLFAHVVNLKRNYELVKDFKYDACLAMRPDILLDFEALSEEIIKLVEIEKDKPVVKCLDKVESIENKLFLGTDYAFLFSSDAIDIHATKYNYFYKGRKFEYNKDLEYREGGHWIHPYYFNINNFDVLEMKVDSSIVRPERDLQILKRNKKAPLKAILKKIHDNAVTWTLIDSDTIERDGIKKSFKGKVV